MELYFVTSNENKLKEARQILGIKIKQLRLDIKEIQSMNVSEVIENKAIKAYESVQKPVIVEDTGLYIKALNGFPGALIKWVLATVGNKGICHMVNGKNREAYAETAVCLFNGQKAILFTGRINGTITSTPIGKTGFGWDQVFRPKGHSLTFAQMGPEEKNKVSMRMIALKKLERYLATHQS